ITPVLPCNDQLKQVEIQIGPGDQAGRTSAVLPIERRVAQHHAAEQARTHRTRYTGGALLAYGRHLIKQRRSLAPEIVTYRVLDHIGRDVETPFHVVSPPVDQRMASIVAAMPRTRVQHITFPGNFNLTNATRMSGRPRCLRPGSGY